MPGTRPHLILRTLSRGDGLLGMRPHGKLGPRGDRVTLIRLVQAPEDTNHRLQWANLPLHPVEVDMLQWRDIGFGLALTPSWTLEREDLFADFAAEDIPRLREAGWEVELAPGFAHYSQAIDGWELEAVEADGSADRIPTLGLSRRKGSWLLSLGVLVQGQRVDLAPMIWDLLRRDKRWLSAEAISHIDDDAILSLRAPGGKRLHSTAAPLKRLMLTLLEVLVAQRSRRTPLALSAWEAARLSLLDGEDSRWQLHGAEALRALWTRLRTAGPPAPVAAPEGLGITLRPYQLQGLAWLQYLAANDLGGILADDMGLGKTAQALAHLWVQKQAGRLTRPALVVAPTSLIFNWAQEAARVAPGLRVASFSDPAQRTDVLAGLGSTDVLLCSYGLAWRELRALSRHRFSVLLVDEAQAVKNPRSRAARALRRLPADQRLVLTGTPLENHLGELWTQFDFLLPGYLGDSRHFTRHWRKPIEYNGSAERARLLAQLVRPFILRRLKEDVAPELPPLTVVTQRIALQGRQRQLYESVRIGADHLVRRVLAQQQMFGDGLISVLDAMLKLRQVCCDPRLVPGIAVPQGMEAAKLEWLGTHIPAMVAEGRRLLVFSQFTGMLALARDVLTAAGIPWLSLTGDTPAHQRGDLVQRFQGGEVPVMLVSLKAGGVGLTLTAADTVIQVDPWWNPAVDAQAMARAHRLGQTRPVFVHQLVIEGSIEERMLELQARKRALADGLLGRDSGEALEKFSPADIERLLAPLMDDGDEVA
ncbi:Superfamily II DNA or RNA helicase, SNF2 family [Roseateles sp. YR242]|uniref:DEAD/DEAH box helicase n=1 Tax=Roseateles sp. YR242 TaxID=1855305 RepID=UPI0008AF91B4|nr:DEAD/DEAH box helicase [Roseateles sp. YR242]SEL76669.1 Superfamily II DNA or RNA helicase, SNF2 family [Roseateles sp. YR242]